jgi:hypothetical protein
MLQSLALGVAFYAVSVLFGVAAVERFIGDLLGLKVFRLAAGIPVGFAFSTYMVLALEAMNSSFSGWLMVIAAAIELALSYLMLRHNGNWKVFSPRDLAAEGNNNRGMYIAIILIAAFLIFLQSHGISTSSTGSVIASFNYGGDLLFHLGQGNSLIYSGFPPRYLYSYNATNVFPFISDFYSAMLLYNGFNIAAAFNASDYALWFAFTAMLILFFTLIGKNYKVSAAAVFMFLFFSLGFNFLIIGYFHVPIYGVTQQTIANLDQNWFGLITYPFFNFSDPFVSNFIIQHDYLLGFPYALVILATLYVLFLEGRRMEGRPSRRQLGTMAFLGLMAGLMPLIHPFSLVFVFLFSVVLLAYSLVRRRSAVEKRHGWLAERLKPWIVYGAVTAIVAAPLLLYMFSQHLESNFIGSILQQSYWWPQIPSITNILVAHALFWLESIGILLPLGIIGLVYFRRRGLIAFLPSVISFLIVNIYRLQPSDGDNNKTTIYFVMFLSLAAMLLLYKLFVFRKGWKGVPFKALAVLLFILATFSGFAADYLIFNGSYTVATPLELNASAWIINNTPAHSVFQSNCYTYTYDFVSTIAGRDTLLDIYTYSYNVGIFNKGADPNVVSGQIDGFFSNPSCSLANEYNISYFVAENITQTGAWGCVSANVSALSGNGNFKQVYSANDSQGSSIAIFKSLCRG